MYDANVLQMNQAKGLIETVIAELEDTTLTAFKNQNLRTRQHVIERLKAVHAELADLVTVAGEISVEPIPQSENTAWEIARSLVDAHRHASTPSAEV
jgi:hypothetical protein